MRLAFLLFSARECITAEAVYAIWVFRGKHGQFLQFSNNINSFDGITFPQAFKDRGLDSPEGKMPQRGREYSPKDGRGHGQPRQHHCPEAVSRDHRLNFCGNVLLPKLFMLSGNCRN